MSSSSPPQYDHWIIERRHDGALLVRVPSRDEEGQPLPEAVFAFQPGNPQYSFWEQQLRGRIDS